MSSIVVTGGAGYIGSVFVEAMCEAGESVVVIDNLSEGHRSAVDPRAELVLGDLGDRALVEQVLRQNGARAVVHFAAVALVGESMRDPAKYYRNNVVGGLTLLEAMVAAQVPRIVFSSTCATYGIPASVPIDEGFPQAPVNPYGHSKLTFEGMLRWFGEVHGLESVMFRYFNAAGASSRFGEHHRVETHLIPNALFCALGKHEAMRVFGTDYPTPDGSAVRDYIHVLDLADAHRRAVQGTATGAFNLGTGRGHSVLEVVEACRRVSGRDIPVVHDARRPGDPPALIAAADKAREVLGWTPRWTGLEDIVGSAWDWHLAHPEGYPD